MKGPLYLEFLQTRRSGWKILIYALAFSFLVALLTAEAAPLMVFGIVLPSLCGMLGLGTFSEEIASGSLRYLFSLPISRFQFFKAKLIGGLSGTLAAAVVAFFGLQLAQLVRPTVSTPEDPSLFGLLSEVPPSKLLLFATAYGLLAFAAGLFSVLFCQEPKAAAWVNQLISWIAFLYFCALLAVFSVSIVPLAGVAFFAAMILLIGSFFLFRRRNPFDSTSQLMVIGMASLSGFVSVLGLGLVIAVWTGIGSVFVQPGVNSFSPAPDGKSVHVLFRRGQTLESLLLDSGGNPLMPLDQEQVSDLLRPIWHGPKSWLVIDHVPGLDSPTGSQAEGARFFEVVNLESRQGWRSAAKPEGLGQFPVYLGWTREGHLVVYGRPDDEEDPNGGLAEILRKRATPSIWLVDLEKGAVEQQSLEVRGFGLPSLTPEDQVVTTTRARSELEIEWRDLQAKTREKLTVFPSPIDWGLSRDGSKLVVARPSSAGFEVELFDRKTLTRKVLLGPADFSPPPGRKPQPWDSPRMSRIEGSSLFRASGPGRGWLIDIETGHLLSFDEEREESLLLLIGSFYASPSGRRAAFLTHNPVGQELRILEITEEGMRWSARAAVQDFSEPAWLGDERLLFLRVGEKSQSFELWEHEIATGTQRLFFPTRSNR